MKIKPHPNGRYYAHVWTPQGPRSISLGTKNRVDAVARAREVKIAELESAAKINALTADTVTRIMLGKRQTGADALAAWRSWAELVGLTPRTITRYEGCIMQFLREAQLLNRPLSSGAESDLDKFVNPTSPIKVSTRKNRLAALQSLFSTALAKGFTASNPSAVIRVRMAGLTFEQRETRKVTPFADAELALLRTIEDPFWKTFVLLGEHYGFRVGDVAQLEAGSLSKPGFIVVHTDKRDRRIELPLNPAVAAHFAALPAPRGGYYFPEARAIALSENRSMLSTYFSRILRRLGIDGKNTHHLRHTFATRRAGLGDTVDEIRLKLGHASASTTAGYIHTP